MKHLHSSAIAALMFLILSNMPTSLGAATITVTNTADTGTGTLRGALASAANGDKITFALTPPAKIILTGGELLISRNVNIAGPGAPNLAVDGNGANRVFRIASNTLVTISGLTITNGHSSDRGAGIRNDHAALIVRDCIVAGNSTDYAGGGIFSDGEFGGNASLSVSNCIFSGNSSSHGGGIFNNGYYGNANVQIMDCTFSNNSVHDSVYGGGGGRHLERWRRRQRNCPNCQD